MRAASGCGHGDRASSPGPRRRPAGTTRSPRSRTASPGAAARSDAVEARAAASRRRPRGRRLGVQARLGELEVPVAELGPEEVVELERGRARARTRRASATVRSVIRSSRERIQRSSTRLGAAGAGATPSSTPSRISREAFHSLFARSRPCLTRSSPSSGRPGRTTSPAARSAARRAPCSASISVERVDPGAERLRHPAAVGRLDHRVDRDVGERQLAGELDPEHHHPRDPEEDDVARRREHVGRVEGAQLGRLAPASRASRTATAPRRTRCRARRGRASQPSPVRRLGADVGLVAAVPDRQLVAPPELARDAPRADVLEPVEVDAGPRALGMEAERPSLARPRSPARRARPCRRTTAARSAARSARPSGASAARRGRRAGCREIRPSSRSAATTARCAPRRPSVPRSARRRPRSSGRPRRSRRSPRGRACGRSRSRSGRGRA